MREALVRSSQLETPLSIYKVTLPPIPTRGLTVLCAMLCIYIVSRSYLLDQRSRWKEEIKTTRENECTRELFRANIVCRCNAISQRRCNTMCRNVGKPLKAKSPNPSSRARTPSVMSPVTELLYHFLGHKFEPFRECPTGIPETKCLLLHTGQCLCWLSREAFILKLIKLNFCHFLVRLFIHS